MQDFRKLKIKEQGLSGRREALKSRLKVLESFHEEVKRNLREVDKELAEVKRLLRGHPEMVSVNSDLENDIKYKEEYRKVLYRSLKLSEKDLKGLKTKNFEINKDISDIKKELI